MKKVIINSALKTLAAVLSLIILALSALTMFAPLRLSELSRNVGAYNLAASFTIIEYNRNKEIQDLSEIVEFSVAGKNYARIVKYASFLTSHSEFKKFCERKDKASQGYFNATYEQYIYGWFVTALYFRHDTRQATDIAKSVTKGEHDKTLYLLGNAMSYLVEAVYLREDKETGRELLNYLQSLYSEMEGKEVPKDEKERLAADIEKILKILSA